MEAILLLGDIIALVLVVIWSARNELLPPGSPSVGLFRYPEVARAVAAAVASKTNAALGRGSRVAVARSPAMAAATPTTTAQPGAAGRPRGAGPVRTAAPTATGQKLAWPPPGLAGLGRPAQGPVSRPIPPTQRPRG
jgi:hypothetical protein